MNLASRNFKILILAAFWLSGAVGHAQEAAVAETQVSKWASHPVISIWPEGTAGVDPSIPEEMIPRNTELVKNIHNPNLTVFRPEKSNGAAVVICPGGGYGVLSTENEGYKVAERLNEVGVTAFVLKYRLPSTPGVDFKHPVPLSDALRGIQTVRYRAEEFGVDPARIGIMGFSAGGHLAASAATLYSNYHIGTDEISKVRSRPDFLCLGYAVISTQKEFAHRCVQSPLKQEFTPEQLAEMSCELNVDAQTPPTFLFHCKDDKGVLPENSVVMHEALKTHGVPTELKLYEKGGHGFGLGRPGTDSSQWSGAFIDWLRVQKIISVETEFYTPPQDRDGLSARSDLKAGLPNVLIIGDSISIAYTKPLIERMKGVANVQRVKANAGSTQRGKKALKQWLGDTQWDVIHFNWGLHDLCYRNPVVAGKVYGNRDKVNGTQSVPLEQYVENLEALVLRLKATGAKLVWASTTLVPEGEAGREAGDELRYNEAAAAIMKTHGVAVNDLHALTAGFSKELFTKPGDVHFKPAGSARLAYQVAQAIQAALEP